ncbi:MAG: ABC transporter permease [Actinomycetales bacterium]
MTAVAASGRLGASDSTIAGLRTTARLAWRQNRIFWTVWVLALVGLMPATVTTYSELVTSDPGALMATLGANPTMRVILGPPFDLSTAGGFAAWRVGNFTGWMAALMSALGVIRCTRADEEAGRLELLRAGAIGRHAPLAGALLVAALVNVVLGVGIAAGMIASGTPTAGSIAAGMGVTSMGWLFAAVAGVAAQVFESARSARAWSVGIVLGGLFVVRAIIDGSGSGSALEPLRWFVPVEWPALVRAYADERWWVLALPYGSAVLLTLAALRLESMRDHGGGLRATRLGPASAPPGLSGPWGLSWRLDRWSIIGWSVALVVSAAGMGSIALQMRSLFDDNPQLKVLLERLGGSGAAEIAFYSAMISILATVLGMLVILLLGRLRSEETAGHIEPLLATTVSRLNLALSHLVPATLVPVALLLACGAVLPVAQVSRDGDASLSLDFLRAAAALTPSVLVVAGIAMLLIGWVPRFFALSWVVVTWTMFCTWLAPLFNLPAWLIDLHPLGPLPSLPSEAMDWTPVLVEAAVGLVLMGVGVVGYRRRNIPAA